jgi:hypothetical protein
MDAGFDSAVAARAVGVARTTVKRWLRRQERGEALARPRGPLGAETLPNVTWRAESIVRELRGLVGAESIRRSVPGLTRREAARIKGETLRKMEEERRAAADLVHVTMPGVLRGFDAMEVKDEYLLVAGDGSIPYRTSWDLVDRYDAAAVLTLLEKDFALWGAPLVLRMDRARQHRTDDLRTFLEEHQVLILHGPPYWPRYYGQLERQNREHRAWLAAGDNAHLDDFVETMIQALNSRWRRCTLGWSTAAEVWDRRSRIDINRSDLQAEVGDRTERLHWLLGNHSEALDLARRLAIEQALQRLGLLWTKKGGWVKSNCRRATAFEPGGLLTLTLRGKAADGFEVQQERNRPQLFHRAWKPGDTDAGFPQRQQAGGAPSQGQRSISLILKVRNVQPMGGFQSCGGGVLGD